MWSHRYRNKKIHQRDNPHSTFK